MYKAQIKDKKITNGVLSIIVSFSDEDTKDTFTDTFQTNQDQPKEWLDEQISRKLKHLNSLQNIKENIEVGAEVVLKEKVEDIQATDKDKESYKKDLQDFNKMVGAAQQGIMTRDNKDFLELKKKLADNFKTEYLDLF
ncbi:MAG: hypothetical protein KBD52_01830 [Candidatus Pacebacteria bacterium]|nr:hypothetical protein [Candidatus Paceibacterota bacterium]